MGRAGGRAGGTSRSSVHRSGSSHSFSSHRSGSSHSFSRPAGRSGGSSFGSSSHRGSTPASTPRPKAPDPVYERPYAPPPVHRRPAVPPPPPVYRDPYPRPVHTTVIYKEQADNSGSRNNDASYAGPYASGGLSLQDIAKQKVKKQRQAWVLFTVIFAVLVLFTVLFASGDAVDANLTNREKLDLPYGYSSDTLTDELGWIKDPGALNRNLRYFYEETGAVPYVALMDEPEITEDGMDAEESYADGWYTENLPHEGFVLFMYFDSGIDGVDGNAYLKVGRQAAVLMDAEAQEIFWDYLDYYWGMDPAEMSEDELFANTFRGTADRIMDQRTESTDVARFLFLCLAVIAGCAAFIMFLQYRRAAEAAKAAETVAILAAGRKDMAEDAMAKEDDKEDLLAKYSGMQNTEKEKE